MATYQYFSLEIFFKPCHDHMLVELGELGELNLLKDTPRCKSLILKGLQRLLLTCLEKNLEIEQALIDLDVQGKLFPNNHPYSNKKCSELLEEYHVWTQDKGNYFNSYEPEANTLYQKPSCTPGSEAEFNDEVDWSIYGSATGINSSY